MRPIIASVLLFVLAPMVLADDVAAVAANAVMSASDIQSGEGYYSIYDYACRMTLTVTGYTGESAVTDVPVYIRLKEGEPSGFSYKYFYNDADDLRFFDSSGRVLNYELVAWNKYGESAFWVHVPTLRNGTTLTLCWNLRDGCALPARQDAYGLWGDYAGVWHMDETITAETAQEARSADATGNGRAVQACVGVDGVYTTTTNTAGVFGQARISDTSTRAQKRGSYLFVPNSDQWLDDLGDTFTLSFWVKVQACSDTPVFASRRANAASTGGFQITMSPTERNKIAIDGEEPLVTPPTYIRVLNKPFTEVGFTHLAFVYHGEAVDIYANGVCQSNNCPIVAASKNGAGLALGNNTSGDGQSLWGCFDEVRIMAGSNSAERIAAEYAIGQDGFYDYETFTNDATAVLKNEWSVEPSITKTTWEAGTHPTLSDFQAQARHNGGSETIVFYDRATGTCLGEKVPTVVGDYRAVITVEAADIWGGLESSIDFRIVTDGGESDLGINVDRVLLMNDDMSGDESAWVVWQGYDNEANVPGYPYWKHVDEFGADASTTYAERWSDSIDFNLGGGSRHEYRLNGKLLWYLNAVRFGNTFNNGDTYPDERDAEGLQPDQNYLPWNPAAETLYYAGGEVIGAYHRYAGQVVMQNALDAAVYSSCYTNGMGTIYFDAVNAFTDNITNAQGAANYKLIVQIATNLVNHPSLPPTDGYVFPKTTGGQTVPQPDEADWQTLSMRVLRFDGSNCTDLGHMDELELAIEEGGTYARFYRVIVPANIYVKGRFRIVRKAIDEDMKYDPDGRAYILIDNVICSKPTDRIDLLPYGRYVSEKTGVSTLGWEGAFDPAFPSTADDAVFGRGKRTCANASAEVKVTSATMHYRWHYLEQKETEWRVADLDPSTFVSFLPLEFPRFQGDIDFWFDLNQCGPYYRYVDYSGTGYALGDTGYTEEIASVTNRATGSDWFVRIREGQSDYAEMVLRIKTGATASPVDVPMQLFDNHLWRGHYRMKQILADGLLWRIEARDGQTSGSTEWESSTNYWYTQDWAGKVPDLPAAGRMSAGDETNAWCRAPCKMDAECLTFQVDDSTRGVTMIRSDYQDFNDWNDAAGGYFTGSSTDTNGNIRATSAGVKTYSERYKSNPPYAPTCATNELWNALYDGSINDGRYEPAYETFDENTVNEWKIGYGQWVYGKYREPNSHVAYQMRGSGMGWMELSKASSSRISEWPRGVDMVSFDARVAQPVAPNRGAFSTASYYDAELDDSISCYEQTNYTFMTRTCFDMQKNEGFSGNASLSLFAYYREDAGAYEARWEQIAGEYGELGGPYEDTILKPAPSGQRLVISRWNKIGEEFQETVLYAVTNSETFKYEMPIMPYASGGATNNLMPFCISVFEYGKGTNVIVAGVRISEKSQSNRGGVGWNSKVSSTYMNDKWHFAYVHDSSADRLESGTYGVLSANCEGLFLTPEILRQATYPSDVKPAKMAHSGWKSEQKLNVTTGYKSCYNDLKKKRWMANAGREISFYGTSETRDPYGFAYAPPEQTVDVYTAPIDNTSTWTLWGSIPITGFGSPKVEPDYPQHLYVRDTVAIRLKAGGKTDSYRTDVVISNVKVTQWLGQDGWSTSEKDWNFSTDVRRTSNDFGYTNIIYTSGWITNGAVLLSAKRTKPSVACSVRSPLFDGIGSRGSGLGSFTIKYRRPQDNVRLKVQIVTNYTYNTGTSLKDMSRTVSESDALRGNRSWYTVTNLNYKSLMENYDLTKGYGEYKASFGFHGAKGLMRIVMDNDVVKDVADETRPNHFGEIEILSVTCKDEPNLDKSSWTGWNMQIIGDSKDTERRMYLPDVSVNDDGKTGQSLALNNSTTADINPAEDPDEFRKHTPFVQTPMFTNALIGQVSFKARKYELSDSAPSAKVYVYGVTDGMTEEDILKDENWEFVDSLPITNTLYTTYTIKTDSKNYRALRLAVVLPKSETDNPPSEAWRVTNPQRVLIDEVTISEAVRAVLAFRNVGAFRTNLDDEEYVEGVPSKEQQPLCNENWGIQAEVTPTMLGDEIAYDAGVEVFLHWYVGESPWGYEKWKGLKAAGSAQLPMAKGSNYVYRSSYRDGAVMAPQEKSGTVVQYMLEVRYWTINTQTHKPTTQMTNWLDATSWTTPDWYAPLDYNVDAEHGAGKTFAGYTILDAIAPGWAWINEANIFGATTETGGNADEQFQYVEVCVPAEADLTGWELRMLEAGVYNNTVTTNEIATFGVEAPAMKSGNMGMSSNKVFRCLGNKKSDKLKTENGTLDGVWKFSAYTSTFRSRSGVDCVYDYEMPIGIQLVRPSGIIEHSIVVVGTNRWGRLPGYREYDPTNIVAKLNQNVPGSKFFYAAEDCCGEGRSGSVTDSQGESADVWANDWACSPGYINTNFTGEVQRIVPQHPTPSGDRVVVYATLDLSGGPIHQFVGGAGSTATNANEMIILPRGGTGTNILYTVDPWYELKCITTNGAPQWTYKARTRTWTEQIGVGASNSITVVAAAQIDSKLRELDLTDKNRYTPAVMDWLVNGRDAKGNKWPKYDTGEIALADFIELSSQKVITNMTLTQMYWLDMDPTISNLALRAGMVKIEPVIHPVAWQDDGEEYKGDSALTNVRMRVLMMITNRNETVDGPRAWTPYILRGLESNYTSWDYTTTSKNWTSETFKVTGILANGLTRESEREYWVPLRWFVFQKDSFYQPDATDGQPFTSDIEIVDPRSISSPGAAAGWYEWCQTHGYTPVFNSWSIDDRLKPAEVQILKPQNYYDEGE